MNKILVVEDEVITSDLLRRYFEMVGYQVVSALTGSNAIKIAAEEQPEVIILDIMLPDMDGYEICRQLRSDERTKLMPIIFLTQKDERRDRLDGLGLGADDYITKPFDVEELRLRVHNIINRMGGMPLVDPRTSLPNMTLIRERLPRILEDPESIFLDVQIDSYTPFAEKYGPVAGNQVVRSAAKIIGDVLHQYDPTGSFIGHPRDDHFLLGLKSGAVEKVERELPERFRRHAEQYYDTGELATGKLKVGGKEHPLMRFKLLQIPLETLRALIAVPDKVRTAAEDKPAEPVPTPAAEPAKLEEAPKVDASTSEDKPAEPVPTPAAEPAKLEEAPKMDASTSEDKPAEPVPTPAAEPAKLEEAPKVDAPASKDSTPQP
jgi:CheY-like chemotaxis protein